jgi:ubiquinone biosynthesis protein
VKDMSVGNMLDSLFAITRDFDMATQPHLLLLQKTMVMVEGVASALDPEINMWETAAPYVRDWLRGELGPEAKAADSIVENFRTLARLPDLVKRIEEAFPPKGAAPPPPPLTEVKLVGSGNGGGWWRYLLTAGAGAGIALLAVQAITGL